MGIYNRESISHCNWASLELYIQEDIDIQIGECKCKK